LVIAALGGCSSNDSPGSEQARETTTTSAQCLGIEGDLDALLLVDPSHLQAGGVALRDELRHVDGVDSVTLLDQDETWTAIVTAAGETWPGQRPEFAPAGVAIVLADDADHAEAGDRLSEVDGYEGGFFRPAPDGDLVFRRGRWGDADVVLFFDPATETGVIEVVRAEVEARPDVESVRYLDQDAAYEEFVELFADSPELVATVSPELLPASLRVLVQEDDLERVDELASAFEDAAGVRDVVVDPAMLERTLGLTEALSGC
jgi:cell division protein FtsX